MKKIITLLFVILLTGCTTALHTLNSNQISTYARTKLAIVHFDSAFNVINRPIRITETGGSTIIFRFNAILKGNKLVGDIIKDSSFAGFESIKQNFRINAGLTDMCCGHHVPKHCVNSHQAMIDTTAKFHCTDWTAAILSN